MFGVYSLLKVSRNTLYEVLEYPKLHLRALTHFIECHLLFSFKTSCIFHLNSVGTLQATIRNSITENSAVNIKVIKPESPVFQASKWLFDRRGVI